MNNPEIMATLCTQDTGTIKNNEIMATLCTQEIKNEQSRDNGNIVYTRHRDNTIRDNIGYTRQSRMNNPEIMATLGTQDTGAIKNEQSRDDGNIGYTRHRGNQE